MKDFLDTISRYPNSATVFLGDNCYRGLRKGFDSSAVTIRRLGAQLDGLNNCKYQGSVYFVPGNHDWYDGLTNTKQYPWKNWAFNFIQILSELAKERPDLLVLVISVRNGGSDAYQQVHRVNPVAIDFKAGGNAERIQQDRKPLLFL